MKPKPIEKILSLVREAVKPFPPAAVDRYRGDPFRVLVSCLLSLRTRDEATLPASEALFRMADTPKRLAALAPATIEAAIKPVLYYRGKARNLPVISQKIISDWGGDVPATMEDLLALPGVGRKTANLVLTLGFDSPGICVDTHVHRIVNRWGYLMTKTPDETEMALRLKLARHHWNDLNGLLVPFGKHICHPTSPRCQTCPLEPYCDKIGVWRFR